MGVGIRGALKSVDNARRGWADVLPAKRAVAAASGSATEGKLEGGLPSW